MQYYIVLIHLVQVSKKEDVSQCIFEGRDCLKTVSQLKTNQPLLV